MDDLISRLVAIKAIEDLRDCYNGFSDTYDKAYIIGALEEVPSVQQKQRWIPVTERLPIGGDDSGAICENVCLLMNDGTVSCGWMNGITKKVYYLNARDDVIIIAPITRVTHWMPLPEPPKEVDDG